MQSDYAVAKLSTSISDSEISAVLSQHSYSIPEARILVALKTGSPGIWSPLLYDLLNVNYERKSVIQFLQSYLNSNDPLVRVACARILLQLGSRSGIPVLEAELTNAYEGMHVSSEVLVSCATTLYFAGVKLDGDRLYKLCKKNGDPMLKELSQLLLSEMAAEEARANLLKFGPNNEAMMIAGLMKLDDAGSIAFLQKFLSDGSPPLTLEHANWALYRATGERHYLLHLVKVAEEVLGIRPKTTEYAARSGEVAFQAVRMCVTAETTASLRSIEAFARSKGDSTLSGRAIAALLYFHRDYSYVDARLMDVFSRRQKPSGYTSLFELAAARSTPEVVEAARAYNREEFERAFILRSNRPIETWIYSYIDSRVPIDLFPKN